MKLLFCTKVLAFCLALLAGWAAQAQATPRTVKLSDERMAQTPQGRERLKYLANCALAEDLVLTAESAGERYTFPGGLGLAPQWDQRAMTEQEQLWVSACMLARTNFYGIKVLLSMRSDFPSNAPGLQIMTEEDKAYPLEEATYFGNLFADKPVGYVCSPEQTAQRRANFAAQRRICALPGADGKTACGMVHVGVCSTTNYNQGGYQYRAAISVFLPERAASEKP